jgi:hypothetical protein
MLQVDVCGYSSGRNITMRAVLIAQQMLWYPNDRHDAPSSPLAVANRAIAIGSDLETKTYVLPK